MLLEVCFGTAIEDHRLRPVDDEQILKLINMRLLIIGPEMWSRKLIQSTVMLATGAFIRLRKVVVCKEWMRSGRGNMFAKVVEPLEGLP
jgi:hypothetical protein